MGGCLNYRFSTTSLVDGETLLRLFKLECEGEGRKDQVCNRGVFKAVNKNRRKVLDGPEMFLPSLDFFYPLNFVCRDCVKSSGIKDQISIMNHH